METPDPRDYTCDYCGKTQWRGQLHPQTVGSSTAWLCDACVKRDQERYAKAVGDAA